MMAVIGERYRFMYPKEFVTLPDYTEHAGQIVTVMRPLTPEEAHPPIPEEGITQMYEIRADDGWMGDAWEEELEDLELDAFGEPS